MNVWQRQLQLEEESTKYWKDKYLMSHDLASRTADERDKAVTRVKELEDALKKANEENRHLRGNKGTGRWL